MKQKKETKARSKKKMEEKVFLKSEKKKKHRTEENFQNECDLRRYNIGFGTD